MKRLWRIGVCAAICMGVSMLCASDKGFDPKKPLPAPDGKPADMSQPVQVFFLMGQSNMLGFGKLSGLKAATQKGLYPYLVDENGSWTVRKDVRNVRRCSYKPCLNDWMSPAKGIGRGKQIGPEIGIGYYVGEVLDAPVLILKVCTGNRSLGYDLLPPSAEKYQGDPALSPRRPRPFKPGEKWYGGFQYDTDVHSAQQVLDDLSTYYPGASRYEIAGFCFWQGAKDLGRGGDHANYEKNLVALIKDLRKDFNAPDALFVCATMGQARKESGGAAGNITRAQLAVDGSTGKYPEFKDNVATFYANPVSRGGSANGHYSGNAETYMNVGEGMGKLMAELLVKKGAGAARKKVEKARKDKEKKAKSAADAAKVKDSKKVAKLLRTAKEAEGMGQRSAAKTFYNLILKKYPDSEAAVEAKKRLKEI